MKVRIGCHVSIAGSLAAAIPRALKRECSTFQIFTRNPRGWQYKDIAEEDSAAFREAVAASGMNPVVAHMPYLPNLASPRDEVYDKSVTTLCAELERCHHLGIPYLVTHLGSTLGTPAEEGRERVVRALGAALNTHATEVTILLENTAGSKNTIGNRFDEIGSILDETGENNRLGICFDTCHAFAAGYDLRTSASVDAVMEECDDTVGSERIHLVHLNDAKADLGSGRDRHEHLGEGMIGPEGLAAVLRHRALHHLPFICETPVDDRRDDLGNIRYAVSLAEGTTGTGPL
ncbi:endonuclease [Methanomicrobiaceae archaeon CYW5]|nr:endonuclease [Methanovulcanius yangii]